MPTVCHSRVPVLLCACPSVRVSPCPRSKSDLVSAQGRREGLGWRGRNTSALSAIIALLGQKRFLVLPSNFCAFIKPDCRLDSCGGMRSTAACQRESPGALQIVARDKQTLLRRETARASGAWRNAPPPRPSRKKNTTPF